MSRPTGWLTDDHAAHDHETTAITHNNYVVDSLVYQSNFTAGLRVLDTAFVGDPDNPRLEELAFFDTFPRHDEPVFSGTWSNYPFFESGTIAVSGIDEGLFLLRLASDEATTVPARGGTAETTPLPATGAGLALLGAVVAAAGGAVSRRRVG